MKKEIITNKMSEYLAAKKFEVLTLSGNKRGFEVVGLKEKEVFIINVFPEKLLQDEIPAGISAGEGAKLVEKVSSAINSIKPEKRKQLTYGIALADTEKNKKLICCNMAFLKQQGVQAYIVGDSVRRL